MTKEKHYEIVTKLNKMESASVNEKIEYLESVIESTDYDNNGFNDEICNILARLKNEQNKKK